MLGRIAHWMRQPRDGQAWLLLGVRAGLPLLIVLVGAVLIAIGHAGANDPTAVTGVVMIGIALMVWLINWLFRMSVTSNADREHEERAREYFDRYGRWPDEP